MKIESIISFPHLLWNWCRKVGFKRILKYGFFYALYVAIVKTFDYIYMPWLAIKFRYFAIVPLYFSLYAVSWLGLWLYRSFREDMLFLEKINAWLDDTERGGQLVSSLKKRIRGNPKKIFMVVSTYWSPVHGYLYFKKDNKDNLIEVFKSFALGSFYCALFWGIVIDIIILIWDLFSILDIGVFVVTVFAVWKIKGRKKLKYSEEKGG